MRSVLAPSHVRGDLRVLVVGGTGIEPVTSSVSARHIGGQAACSGLICAGQRRTVSSADAA